jgi:mannose-6-phosphate isomerase-like protein (cupin superfamily)
MPEPQVRRAAQRYLTERDGIRTLHSFSYGDHYDPENIAFGPLVAINVEHVPPGGGYAAHRHSDVEIVTWVLEGTLAHEDSTGTGGLVRPGTLQRLSAGAGAEHTERNASTREPLHFVQTMLRSRHAGDPEYATSDAVGTGLLAGVSLHADAALTVARPDGTPLALPSAPALLIHVTRGRLHLEAGETRHDLDAGDEVRAHPDTGDRWVLAGFGEALVWAVGG